MTKIQLSSGSPRDPQFDSVLTDAGAGLRRRAGGALRAPGAAAAAPRASSARRASTPASCPDFLPETRAVREGDWSVAPIPADLQDRRVEITGPVRPQDDHQRAELRREGLHGRLRGLATRPTWDNVIEGQLNLRDAVARHDRLHQPRGQGLPADRQAAPCCSCARAAGTCYEKHVHVDGEPMPGALFDFGLYFFHNARGARGARHRPVFLPAQAGEPSRGAALERRVRLRRGRSSASPHGTIKATVLIETILAAFEMDEILYELRDHSAA